MNYWGCENIYNWNFRMSEKSRVAYVREMTVSCKGITSQRWGEILQGRETAEHEAAEYLRSE